MRVLLPRYALVLGAVGLGAAWATPASAASDGKTANGFTSYVSAVLSSPAANAVFHTGGPSNSMIIDFASDNVAKVTSDGTNNVDHTFAFLTQLYDDSSTNIIDEDLGGPTTIHAGVAGTFG